MIRLLPFFILLTGVASSCNESNEAKPPTKEITETKNTNRPQAIRHFRGAISNGMKGDSISFDISADGTQLSNLTFKGYWRCSGRLESVLTGPEGAFTITNSKVDDHISEPPGGGSTAWRFDLQASIDDNTAEGTFRMNINNLGCDSYKLKWTAEAE